MSDPPRQTFLLDFEHLYDSETSMSNVKHPNDDAAVGYLRLSVVRREDPFSPPNQRRLIERRAEQDSKRIVAWYDDFDKTARKPRSNGPATKPPLRTSSRSGLRRCTSPGSTASTGAEWAMSARCLTRSKRVPLADRVGIVWVGEDPPTPRNVQRSGDD
jgi:hypothetical protein